MISEDIEWFKPIEIHTHGGRRGRIKQPLGTHGLVKCIFDQPMNTQDSVLMNLYKRVFPKWTYNPSIAEDQSSWKINLAQPEDFMEHEEIVGGSKRVTFQLLS